MSEATDDTMAVYIAALMRPDDDTEADHLNIYERCDLCDLMGWDKYSGIVFAWSHGAESCVVQGGQLWAKVY